MYGNHIECFINNVTNILYENNECDMTLVCGDMNGTIGDELDYVPEIDDVIKRVVIDDVLNPHGQALCDFMLECKLIALNGRICPLEDNFTCVSAKGRSVVDYVLSSVENIDNIVSFRVAPVNNLLLELDLVQDIEGRVSDHALLICEFTPFFTDRSDGEGKGGGVPSSGSTEKPAVYQHTTATTTAKQQSPQAQADP